MRPRGMASRWKKISRDISSPPTKGENLYEVTAHLSNDFRRTSFIGHADDARAEFENAALSGCYDGGGFRFRLLAPSHEDAAHEAWHLLNRYPCEVVHGDYKSLYFEMLTTAYREAGNRSLSVGDVLVIRNVDHPSAEDGRYGVGPVGFVRF